MSVTKLERIEHIVNMISQMDSILEYCDMQDTLKLHEATPLFSNKSLVEGEKWLYNILISEYMEVKRIWDMQRSELWFRYKKWGICDENRETILLNEKLAIFKKAIKSSQRPALFKKGRTNAWAKRLDKKETRARPRKNNPECKKPSETT